MMKFPQKIRSLSRKAKLAVAVLALGVGVAVPFAVQAEFYPDRPTFDYNKSEGLDCHNPNNPSAQNGRCGSMHGPVFNSFVNTPSYGDERSFVDARRSDQTAVGSYKNVLPDVTKGSKEIVVRMYVHNNANGTTNASGLGIARDTRVRLALPTTENDALRAVGYISASNSTPRVVEDTVDFTSTEKFRVAYKPGSAVIYNNGPLNGAKLSDSIVSAEGAPIGYDALNGNLPGCFEYEAVVQVTLTVTPAEVPNLGLTKQVRKYQPGQTGNWATEVNAKPGDEVEWMLNTKNTGAAAQTNVVTRDVLPPHVELVQGSVQFTNARGSQTLANGPLFDSGYNAGRYDPADNTLIIFRTKVLGDFEECQTRVRNVAYAHSAQYPEIRDDADVVITRENCQPENPTYSCDLLKAEKLTGRTVKYTASASASGGATIKNYVFEFGDGQSLTTDKNIVEHTYARDGQFVTRVKVNVAVGNETKVAESDKCAAAVDFNTPVTPAGSTTPGAPSALPETGAGSVAAIFVAVTTASTAAYYAVTRRLGRI